MTISLLMLVPARKTSADRRASSTRSGLSPAKITHFTSRSGLDLARCMMVPPAPISMSSQWAPRQSTRFTRVKSRTDSIAAPRELLRLERDTIITRPAQEAVRTLVVALETVNGAHGIVLGQRGQKWVPPRGYCRLGQTGD